MKIALSLILFCIVRALNAQNSDETQPQDNSESTGILSNFNPIQRIADFGNRARERAREGAREGSTILRGFTDRTIGRVQNILSEVRNRADFLEKRAKNDIHKMRSKANQLMNRLKTAGEDGREQIEREIEELNERIESRKDKLKNDLFVEKERVQSSLKLIRNTETEMRSKLQNEIKRLSGRISELGNTRPINVSTDDKLPIIEENASSVTENKNKTRIIPEIRGLGDGYGRHL